MTEIEQKPKANMWIVGINIIVMAFYAAILGFGGGEGILAVWIIMIVHVAICFIVGIAAAISDKTRHNIWPWILSGIIILIIGLSTCFMAVSNMGHM